MSASSNIASTNTPILIQHIIETTFSRVVTDKGLELVMLVNRSLETVSLFGRPGPNTPPFNVIAEIQINLTVGDFDYVRDKSNKSATWYLLAHESLYAGQAQPTGVPTAYMRQSPMAPSDIKQTIVTEVHDALKCALISGTYPFFYRDGGGVDQIESVSIGIEIYEQSAPMKITTKYEFNLMGTHDYCLKHRLCTPVRHGEGYPPMYPASASIPRMIEKMDGICDDHRIVVDSPAPASADNIES